jgi:formylmethanofuran dehydrogenase subunit E
MADINLLLARAREFHGDMCPGIVLGTRMTMIGMRELHMDPMVRNRNLIVYVEIDRCIADAIQAITGCSLGHRTLKYLPYGKFAATFVNLATQDAVRVSVLEKKRTEKSGPEAMKEAGKILRDAPENELFGVRKVRVMVPEGDLPGLPKHRARCSRCGEMILDDKEVVAEETIMCGNCSRGSYYTEEED